MGGWAGWLIDGLLVCEVGGWVCVANGDGKSCLCHCAIANFLHYDIDLPFQGHTS